MCINGFYLALGVGGEGGVELMYKIHSHVYTITSCVFKIFYRMDIHNHDIYFILYKSFPLFIIWFLIIEGITRIVCI